MKIMVVIVDNLLVIFVINKINMKTISKTIIIKLKKFRRLCVRTSELKTS